MATRRGTTVAIEFDEPPAQSLPHARTEPNLRGRVGFFADADAPPPRRALFRVRSESEALGAPPPPLPSSPLARAIKRNSTLKFLNVRCCGISEEALRDIGDFLLDPDCQCRLSQIRCDSFEVMEGATSGIDEDG